MVMRSAMPMRSSARSRSRTPSSVSRMEKDWRVNSFFPSSSSRDRSAFDSVGCVTCRIWAARVMFSSRATARKYRRVRISMVIPPDIPKIHIMI